MKQIKETNRFDFLLYLSSSEIISHHKKTPWLQIPTSMEKKGLKSCIVCSRYSAEFEPPCKIVETHSKKGSWLSGFFELSTISRVIRMNKPYLVFQVNVRSFLFLIVFITKLKAPISGSFRKQRQLTKFVLYVDWDYKMSGGLGLTYLLRKALYTINSHILDLIIFPTTCAMERALNVPYFNGKRAIHIPNGYSSGIYQLQKYDFFERKNYILCVARFNPSKGQDILLNAFELLASDFPDWSLILAGAVDSFDFFQSLKTRCSDLGLKKVVFISTLSESKLSELYKLCKIFVLPSREESFGNVKIEAIANGVPVVTSEAGCSEDSHNMGMVVFKSGDSKDLSSKLRPLLMDEGLRQSIANNARKSIISYDEYVRLLLEKIDGEKI